MKKEIKKTGKIVVKKETDTEMLARLVVSGFDEVKEKFEKIDERFEKMEGRFEKIDERFDTIDSRLTNLTIEQQETNRRLASIERKQMGMLLSLDETVHRNEFNKVVERVKALENR